MSDGATAETKPTLVQRVPNSLIVLLAVGFLLQGPVGAFDALWKYTKSLAEALLGGEDLFLAVICQTAPLTFSVAAIAFAYRSQWLTLRTGQSIVACSAIVLSAAWLGGQLRSFTASRRPLAEQVGQETPTAVPARTVQGRSDTGITVLNASYKNSTPISLAELKAEQAEQAEPEDTISVDEAFDNFLDFSAVATDGARHDWRENVPRVALLPEPKTFVGLVAKAVNQLLGYIAFYRPRLFFAAVLLGVYIGWSWQPHFEPLLSWLSRRKSNVAPSG